VQAGKRSSKESKKVKQKSSNLKNQSDYCYDDIDHPYVFFATKTAYRWNRNKHDDEISPPGKFCNFKYVVLYNTNCWYMGKFLAYFIFFVWFRLCGSTVLAPLKAWLP
jgi:hypothetical protein